MPKSKFPFQTRDSIEMLYHEEILKNFPHYRTFWEEFIGVRVETVGLPIRPYKLKVPTALKPQEAIINDLHEKICMIHYACFCHLASARYELGELIIGRKLTDPTMNHFRHWQAFEASYLHLGASWQEIKILWEYVYVKLKNLNPKSSNIGAVRDYFDSNPFVDAKLEDMQKNIINFRNDIAHFARRVNRKSANGYEVPKSFQKNVSWTTQSATSNWTDTYDKLEDDIQTCERAFDITHPDLINELRSIIQGHGISIDYGSGQKDDFCSICSWWMSPINLLTPLSSGSHDSTSFSNPTMTPSTLGSSSVQYSPLASGLNNPPSGPPPPSIKKRLKCQNPKCKQEIEK